jgi:hypothetical protein
MGKFIVLVFFAGVLAANATPHFVKGITKERFPTLLGSGPVVNLICGWAMLTGAVILLLVADPADDPAAAIAAGALGVLVMGVFHAWHGAFGRS